MKHFNIEVRKTIVVTLEAESLEDAKESILEDLPLGEYDQSFHHAEPEMMLLDVAYGSEEELEAAEALLEKHGLSVYYAEDVGKWGYTGCEADDYATCAEATEAALVMARLAESQATDDTEG